MIASLQRAVARGAAIAVLCIAGTALSQPPLPPLPPPDEPAKPAPSQPGVKVADQGPIHEAFAQPGAEVRGKEMTAPKAPPPPLKEVPPDVKPEGDNVKWIPGYWAWDEGKNDFIWVSGFYRNAPPNREWEPGKWTEKDGKNVYTPGYWKPTDGKQVLNDLPEPPKSLENGPSSVSDNSNAMWVPGGWEYQNSKFVWRAGYWALPYQNLMWQPGQYVYGTGGYTYVPGYWDYPLEQRGLLNAPVYIDPQLAQNPNWTYTPRYGVDVGSGNGWGNGGLFNSLYMGPNYNNYYYGGYSDPYGLGGLGFGMGYGDPMFGLGGFYPWWFAGPGFYNPLWNHYNWLNRGNTGWGENTRGRNGSGRNGTARNGTKGSATTGRSVGGAAGAAGTAARDAARSAVNANANQIVRPANQVLANQGLRSSASSANGGGYGLGGSGIPLNRTYSAGGLQSNGVTIRPGITNYGSAGAMPGVSNYGNAGVSPGILNYGNAGSIGGYGYGIPTFRSAGIGDYYGHYGTEYRGATIGGYRGGSVGGFRGSVGGFGGGGHSGGGRR